MAPGEAATFVAAEVDASGAPLPGVVAVTWSTSPPGVASVDALGLVTALAPGVVQVTATVGTRSAFAPVTVTDLPAEASQAIGTGGGTLTSPLSNGATLEVVVPAGAIGSTTTFAIRPSLRTPGEATRFAVAPAGFVFDEPIQLVYDPPASDSTLTQPFLTWESGGIGPVRMEEDGTGRWIATVSVLGGVTEPAPSTSGAPRASDTSGEAFAEAAVENFITNTDILLAGQDALDAFLSAPSLVTAHYLFEAIETVATMPYTEAELPTARAFLEAWRSAVCVSGAEAVARYEGLADANWDLPDFERESRLLAAWAVGAEQTTLRQELNLPFDGCVGGQPPFRAAIEAKATNLLPRVPGLVNPPDRDLAARFDEVIDVHLRRVLDFIATLGLFGAEDLQQEVSAIPTAMASALRATAWEVCRTHRDQTRIDRLLAETTGPLSNLAGFTSGDLVRDLAGCTTQIDWRVRPHDAQAGWGTLATSGTMAAPAVASPLPELPLQLQPDQGLVLAGLVQPIVCPGNAVQGIPPSLNDESLLVIARPGIAQSVMATRNRPASIGIMYLQADSIELTPSALATAAGGNDWTELELAIMRQGNSCAGVVGQLMPNSIRLATIQLTRRAPVLALLGSQQQVSASTPDPGLGPACTRDVDPAVNSNETGAVSFVLNADLSCAIEDPYRAWGASASTTLNSDPGFAPDGSSATITYEGIVTASAHTTGPITWDAGGSSWMLVEFRVLSGQVAFDLDAAFTGTIGTFDVLFGAGPVNYFWEKEAGDGLPSEFSVSGMLGPGYYSASFSTLGAVYADPDTSLSGSFRGAATLRLTPVTPTP